MALELDWPADQAAKETWDFPKLNCLNTRLNAGLDDCKSFEDVQFWTRQFN